MLGKKGIIKDEKITYFLNYIKNLRMSFQVGGDGGHGLADDGFEEGGVPEVLGEGGRDRSADARAGGVVRGAG